MPVAFNSGMLSVTPGADDIYPFKLRSPFDIFDTLPSRCPGIFTLEPGVYAAFVNINTLCMRNPLYLSVILRPFLFGFFVIGT
jgi:hypothetical protein